MLNCPWAQFLTVLQATKHFQKNSTNVLIALLNEVALRSTNFLSLLYPPPPPPVGAVRLVAFYPSDIILFMSIKVAGWGFSGGGWVGGGEHLPGLSINYVAINIKEKWPPQPY